MSTLDDRRAVDESGGGGRGNGAQRGGGQSHAAWSNLSRGRTNVPLDGLVPTASLSRAISLAELRFVREPFARCDPSESGGNARETPRSRARSRGPERPAEPERCRAACVGRGQLAVARPWPRASAVRVSRHAHDVVSRAAHVLSANVFPRGGLSKCPSSVFPQSSVSPPPSRAREDQQPVQ